MDMHDHIKTINPTFVKIRALRGLDASRQILNQNTLFLTFPIKMGRLIEASPSAW